MSRKSFFNGDLLAADRVVNTLEEAINESPKTAILANPAPFHVPVANVLAENGCHLLVEKPLSDSLYGLDTLINTCESRGLTLMVGYNLRFCPSLQAMARMVADDIIGELLHVSAETGQYLPDWRPLSDYRDGVTAQAKLGGGALLELSHEIDIALWMGGPVAYLTASLGRVGDLEIDTEDYADLLMDFRRGGRGYVHVDLLQRVPTRGCRVIGSKGTLEWDYFADALRLGRPGESWQQLGVPRLNERNDMYLNELAHFFACVELGALPLVPACVGRDVLTIALAARDSAAMKRTVEIMP